jgi:hypothetical protein
VTKPDILPVTHVLLPVALLFFAIVSAAVVAYGNNPDLARFGETGVQAIMVCRRMQWPMVTLSVVLCVIVIALVIAGKRRAWWLIGLAPVLALFLHRFGGTTNNYLVLENPPMLSADEVSFLRPDDFVVGVVFDEQAYAYPYAALYSAPVVIQSDRGKRMMLLWSPFANVARAYVIDRGLTARELDVVSMPANALLVYNTRLGQFINGITGRTQTGSVPSGMRASIVTSKMTWKQWRAANPETKVLPTSGRVAARAPASPVLPAYVVPEPSDREFAAASPTTAPATASTTRPTNRSATSRMARSPATVAPAGLSRLASTARVVVFPTSQPVAISSDRVTAEPLNLVSGHVPVLLFRDRASGGLRAFDRRIDEDLSPRFTRCSDRKRAQLGVALVDLDTNTGWSAAGVAVDGPDKRRRGQKLKAVEVDEDVYWGVMHFWFPNLRLIDDSPAPGR